LDLKLNHKLRQKWSNTHRRISLKLSFQTKK
jgi:hypothetical protein